jgi:hypothetical protein
MRGAVVPPALIFVALGLALTFAPRSARAPSLIALLATLGAFMFLAVPKAWLDGVFWGCWISVIATAASVHLSCQLSRKTVVALAINAGVWASAVVCVSGSPFDLLKALPCVLIFLPASWIVVRHSAVPVKVVSSWVIAVAVLAATLQLIPVTPGYLPDHLE